MLTVYRKTLNLCRSLTRTQFHLNLPLRVQRGNLAAPRTAIASAPLVLSLSKDAPYCHAYPPRKSSESGPFRKGHFLILPNHKIWQILLLTFPYQINPVHPVYPCKNTPISRPCITIAPTTPTITAPPEGP